LRPSSRYECPSLRLGSVRILGRKNSTARGKEKIVQTPLARTGEGIKTLQSSFIYRQ